ncbi:hypothetical protein [Dysgonomonas sp.]
MKIFHIPKLGQTHENNKKTEYNSDFQNIETTAYITRQRNYGIASSANAFSQ